MRLFRTEAAAPLILGVILCGLAAWGNPASAQVPGNRPNANVPAMGPSTQPLAVSLYANPYMNPWMNPMAIQGQGGMNRADMGWYLYASQQVAGGIGTGRISGTRPDPRAAGMVKPSREVGMPAASRVPGGNAASYFQRGGRATAAPSRFYNRGDSHFLSNGH